MSGLGESVESSGRAGKFRVAASWVGAGVSASQFFRGGAGGLVLPGNRGDSIASDALSAITSGAGFRCPFELADPHPANGPMIFLVSRAHVVPAHPISPLFASMYWLLLLMTPPRPESWRLNMR